jgi:hypothetical protein
MPLRMLGDDLGRQRWLRRCRKKFQRALDLDSLNPNAYRELGSAYEAMNRIQDAENT